MYTACKTYKMLVGWKIQVHAQLLKDSSRHARSGLWWTWEHRPSAWACRTQWSAGGPWGYKMIHTYPYPLSDAWVGKPIYSGIESQIICQFWMNGWVFKPDVWVCNVAEHIVLFRVAQRWVCFLPQILLDLYVPADNQVQRLQCILFLANYLYFKF